MGPLQNTPYLKRRHFVDEGEIPPSKVRIVTKPTNYTRTNRLKRKHWNSCINSSDIVTTEKPLNLLGCEFSKRPKVESGNIQELSTMNSNVNNNSSMRCSTEPVLNEYCCVNYWKTPVEDISLSDLLKTFEGTKEDKMEEDGLEESNRSLLISDTLRESAEYNNFNFWKSPLPSLHELDFSSL